MSYSDQFIQSVQARGIWTKRALLFLAGAGYSLAFAPSNIFPVIFLSFPVLYLFAVRATSNKEAFAVGWWFAFGLLVSGMGWIGNSFTQQDAVPAMLAPIAVVGLTAILAIYTGLTTLAFRFLPRKGMMGVFVFAALFTLFEMARGTLFTGLPWLIAGSIWSEWSPVAQGVYYLSVYGLGFATVVIALAPVGLLEDWATKPRWILAGVAGGIATLIVGSGSMRLIENPTNFHVGLNLRLVQANVQQYEKWIPHLINDHFDNHIRLSRKGSRAGKIQGVNLLIWPETAVQRQSFDREGSTERWRMSRLLPFGSYAITGVPRVDYEGDKARYYNSLMVINSRGHLFARYDKRDLVPFGEYMPGASLFDKIGLSSLTGNYFSSGGNRLTVPIAGLPAFSPLICYEAIFPGASVGRAEGIPRPRWLLNITNDGWFGRSKGPYQHLALARLRAIEEGLPLVRAASTGVSAVIDPLGRDIARLELGEEGTLDSRLPTDLPAPSFSSISRIRTVAFLLVAFIIFARFTRRRFT